MIPKTALCSHMMGILNTMMIYMKMSNKAIFKRVRKCALITPHLFGLAGRTYTDQRWLTYSIQCQHVDEPGASQWPLTNMTLTRSRLDYTLKRPQ